MTITHRRLSRRRFCLCCIGAVASVATVGWPSPRHAFAQAQGIVEGIRSAAAAAPITVQPLRGNVSVLEGSGGNVAVLTGPDGKLMIDTGIAVSRPQMEAALRELGPEPVTTVINTHWHFDHADGNTWLSELRPRIIAHESTRKHLSTVTRVDDWDHDFDPLPAGALPGEMVSDGTTVTANGTTLSLTHVPAAHTDSDLFVVLEEPDIVHMGDLFWNDAYPFIDHSTGGTVDGTIAAVDTALERMTDRTIVVPGHGRPASDKAELTAFRDMLASIRDAVGTLKHQGRSLEETIAAKPTALHDARFGGFVITPAFFTSLVYADA